MKTLNNKMLVRADNSDSTWLCSISQTPFQSLSKSNCSTHIRSGVADVHEQQWSLTIQWPVYLFAMCAVTAHIFHETLRVTALVASHSRALLRQIAPVPATARATAVRWMKNLLEYCQNMVTKYHVVGSPVRSVPRPRSPPSLAPRARVVNKPWGIHYPRRSTPGECYTPATLGCYKT